MVSKAFINTNWLQRELFVGRAATLKPLLQKCSAFFKFPKLIERATSLQPIVTRSAVSTRPGGLANEARVVTANAPVALALHSNLGRLNDHLVILLAPDGDSLAVVDLLELARLAMLHQLLLWRRLFCLCHLAKV